MKPIHRTLALLSGLLLPAITLIALAPMASAMPPPPPPGGTAEPIPSTPVAESAAGSGLPIWGVLLIATAAAVLGMAVTLLAVALRNTRRRGQLTPT
ncbi:MAG TPA: hypothetical protein VH912_32670 [Streptosporangiaceae bacterium]|jgi:hypothetical protein